MNHLSRTLLCTLLMGGAAFAEGFVTRSLTHPWTLELDGKPFIPYGLNRFAVMNPENNRDNWSTEQYIRQAANRGVNTLRIFVPEPQYEGQLGVYDIEQVKRLDQTVKLAEKYHVKLIVCLFDHWVFRNVLDTSMYGITNGGPLNTGKDFYTSEAARPYQARRIEFIVSRYKDSPAILAWEPMNELNGVSADYPGQHEEAMNWLHFAVSEIKKVDAKHLITESLTGDVRWEELWSDPVIDLVQIHTYRDVRNPDRAATVARNYIRWAQDTFQKPSMVGEYAPLKAVDAQTRADFITAAMLASFATGGSSLLWTHKNDEFGDVTDEEWAAYQKLGFLPDLFTQAGPQGDVPTEGGFAYRYGPTIAAYAAGGHLKVNVPFQNYAVRSFDPESRKWVKSAAMQNTFTVSEGTFVLFEARP